MPSKHFLIPGYSDLYLDIEFGTDEGEEYCNVCISHKVGGGYNEQVKLHRDVINAAACVDRGRGHKLLREALDDDALEESGWGDSEVRAARIVYPDARIEFQVSEYDSAYPRKIMVPASLFREAYQWINGGEAPKLVDISRYPHTCPKCRGKCYIGFQVIEHMPGKSCVQEKEMDDIPF